MRKFPNGREDEKKGKTKVLTHRGRLTTTWKGIEPLEKQKKKKESPTVRKRTGLHAKVRAEKHTVPTSF